MGNVGVFEFMILGAILIAIGIFGLLSRKNLITIILALEVLFAGVNLSFAALAHFTGTVQGVSLLFFIMAIAACETVLILSFALISHRLHHDTSISSLSSLREDI